MYVNEVTVIGNLTRDPELKALPSGVQVANLSVAVNRRWKDRDGKEQEAVEYINYIAFSRTAEIIGQYVFKGHQIYVKGRMQTRSWEKDGQKQYRTEVLVERFQFGQKPSGEKAERTKQDEVNDMYEGKDAAPTGALEYPTDDIDPSMIPF